jgi:hypothetical protein
LSLLSDWSFQSYEEAVRHFEPVASDTQILHDQGYVDAHITHPLHDELEMSIRTTAGPEFGDALKVTVRHKPLDGESRTLIVTRAAALSRQSDMVACREWFVGLALEHIPTGFDHMLFCYA